jgi:hypothetical protein
MIANMRYRLTVALGYLALMTWLIYGVIDRGHDVSNAAGIITIFFLPVVLGLLLGRWWAALLPVAVFLISVPAGYSADTSQELPIWFGVGFLEGFAVPLVLIGVVARKLSNARARRSEPSHS